MRGTVAACSTDANRRRWVESARMKIAVCVKAVPDAASGRRIDPATNRLDRSGELTISEWDTYAIEEALRLKEEAGDGEVVVVSMGPERALDALRKALAMGADRAVLVSDAALEGADLLGTAKALAGALGARAPSSCSSASSRQTAAAPASGPRSPSGCGPGRLAGQRARRRGRLAHREAPDRVRLRHDPRAAAGGGRGRRLDQHAAVPVAEGDHGREEEAAGDASRRRCRRRRAAATTVRRAQPAARRAASRRRSRTTAPARRRSSSSSSRRD